MKNSKNSNLLISCVLASTVMVANSAAAGYVQFNAVPSWQQIVRPGVGFQDPVRFLPTQNQLNRCISDKGNLEPNDGFTQFESNRKELNNAGLQTGAMYVRLNWQQFEPNDNDWQFQRIDDLLECARLRGQAVDLRVMLTDPFGQAEKGLPSWLNDGRRVNGSLHYPFRSNIGSNTGWYDVPNFTNPVLKKEHGDFIRALGARFDGHKDLNSIDIGSIGWWGEWHYKAIAGTYELNDDFMPAANVRQEIIQLYIDSFPNTPKVALEGAYVDVLSTETAYDNRVADFLRNNRDIGWRADSWGKQYFNDRYDDLVYREGVFDTWKTGMVSLEINGNAMTYWPGDSTFHDIVTATNRATNWNVSTINSKLGGFPVQFQSEIRQLSAEMGYRITLKDATFNSTVAAGAGLGMSMNWLNSGIAPMYRNFVISIRLKDSAGNVVYRAKSGQSLKGLLDENGVVVRRPNFNIPAWLSSGTYTLETGLVFDGTNNGSSYANDYTTLVPISVTTGRSDRWLELGSVSVTNGSSSQVSFSNIIAGGGDRGSDPTIWRLTDGQINYSNAYGHWSNDGNPDRAYVNLHFNAWKKVTSVEFSDRWPRRVNVGVFNASGVAVWTGVFNTTQQQTSIPIPNQWGTRVSVWADTSYSSWFTPHEIRVLAAD